MTEIFTRKEAAFYLRISVETLDRYRRRGMLPYHKIGDRIVFTQEDQLLFLEACAVLATVIPTARVKQLMKKGGKWR